MSYSVFPQVFFIVAASLAYVYLSARSRFEGKEKRFANTCSIFLVVFITVLLYLAFVGRDGTYVRSLTLTPFNSYKLVLTNYNTFDILKLIFENILVFIPLGILAPEALNIRKKRWVVPFTIASGAFVSFVIELSQFTFAAGYTEFDDIINNTLGTVIGCGIFCFAGYVEIDGDGLHIKKGWLNGTIPVAVIVTAMLMIVLYREIILYKMS